MAKEYEAAYEKRLRIKREQKAKFLKKQEENKKKSSEDDIVRVRAKKPLASKLGSGASSSGSRNPTSVFQNMKDKKKDNKPSTKSEKAYAVVMKMLKSRGKASGNETSGPAKSASSVKIKSGSNLSTIAQKAGITLKQLLAANPKYAKNPNKINVGDTVKIPAVSKKKGSVYEGMSKSKMASMDMKNGGTPMKKKTKYMAKGGYGTPTKKMVMKAGGTAKKTKYMAKGGMKKTKYMAKGGAAKRK